MPADALVVLTTCPDPDSARKLAAELVEARLAACVNVICGVQSTYRWRGNVERDDEVLLLIKTRAGALERVGSMIQARSSYELPELLTVCVEGGSQPYLNWLIQSVDIEEVRC
jgi:periplasmic divalent cation tolerance protein